MASCVGGVYAGVNKVADIVPVKILPPSRAGPSLSDLVNAFGLIMMDLTSRGRVGVINMSFDFDLAALPVIPSQALNTMDPFRDIVNRFTGLAVLVVASGNDPTADLATATPQTNGGANTDMIVVGAASLNHLRAPFSTFLDSSKDDILTIYGPGVDVVAADLAPTFPFARYTTTSGSSHATAIVAAIISIYLTLGMTSINNAKAFLLQQAITLKGNNWPPDQGSLTHPRAGIAVQVTCTPTVSTDIPFATVPLTTTFNPDITIATPSVDTNFITDIDSDLLVSASRTRWC
jgi:hypothetical protein